MFAFDEDHRLYGPVRAMVRDQFEGGIREPSLRVHERDEMYEVSVTVCPTPEFGAMAYFRAGLQILDALKQTASWHDKPFQQLDSVLDFAAGYGRSTRFLAATLPSDRIWAAEILPEAVRFQQTELHVSGLQSTTQPADFACDLSFDLIFVSSLFSHLPERTWGPWLERLYTLLAPGGLLVFSVHDQALVEPEQMPEDGFLFLPQNEADSWDVADYGSTFISEHRVAQTIAKHLDTDEYVRLPKSLCFQQDLYLIRRQGSFARRDKRFRRGTYGALDEFRIDGILSGSFEASGWAIDMDEAANPLVLFKVGSTVCATAKPSRPRPDTLANFGLSDGGGAVTPAWTASFRLPTDLLKSTATLCVTAKSSVTNREFVLDLLPPGSLSFDRNQRIMHLARTAAKVRRETGWQEVWRLAVLRMRRWLEARRGKQVQG